MRTSMTAPPRSHDGEFSGRLIGVSLANSISILLPGEATYLIREIFGKLLTLVVIPDIAYLECPNIEIIAPI